jgi:hypothetical protein
MENKKYIEVALELLKGALADGGATVMLDGSDVPSAGYVVSLDGLGAKFNVSALNLSELVGWVKRAMENGARCLGSWLDGEVMYFDVNVILNDLKWALEFARDNKQLAIYDLARKESIYVS